MSAGLKSSYGHDYQGWVTNLTTPYGATTFINYTNGLDAPGNNEFGSSNAYMYIRAVKVVDPMQGTNLYMLRQDSSKVVAGIYGGADRSPPTPSCRISVIRSLSCPRRCPPPCPPTT